MDAKTYQTIREDLGQHIRKVDARRNMEQFAIRAFGAQFNAKLDLGSSVVEVGTMSAGVFKPNEFTKGEGGGTDFDVQLRFSPIPNVTLFPAAKFNMRFDENEKAFWLTALISGQKEKVPYRDNQMSGAFDVAFYLVKPGIDDALQEFRDRY